ncbi:hypothetical protein [Brevundimonas sp. GCM10030266]|uniref:hypothetical protein n=1 Tax=Brevundimonas sp. GCM10030266 TaxID=3273386 RepID=UPI003616751C
MTEVTEEMIYDLAVAIRSDLDDLLVKMKDLKLEATALRLEIESFPRFRPIDPAH